MVLSLRILALLLLAPLLTQCGIQSAPASASVTGPFDSRGNYVEDWVDDPDKWYRPPSPGAKPNRSRVTSTETARPTRTEVYASRTSSSPVVAKATPKPKAKPKPKPKPKPSFTYHKVRRGDTLSALSRRYGTSVSNIKRANGISGTIIRLGETLKIPK